MSANTDVHYFTISEFNSLLKKKSQLDKKLEQLRSLIMKIMEIFPRGVVVEEPVFLKKLLQEDFQRLPEEVQRIISNQEIGTIVCDKKDFIMDISANLIADLGYPADDLIGAYKGKLWVERPAQTGPADLAADDSLNYNIYRVKQKHFPAVHEDAYITCNGKVVPVLQHQLNLLNPRGEIAGFLYLIINLSEEKVLEHTLTKAMDQIERELLNNEDLELTPEMKKYLSKDIIETKEYLNNILETSVDGILITSPSGHILGCNQSFRKMVGYAEEELVNQPVTLLSPLTGMYPEISGGTIAITEDYVRDMVDMLTALFEKERVYAHRQHFINHSGVLIPTEVNLSLLKNREEKIIGILRNIHNLTEREKLKKKITLLEKELSETYRLDNIAGKSRSMQEIFRLLKKVADSESTVLIQGESGTGKELIARAIYHHSPRSKGPFVILNCGAIPYNLLESELFGHVKGSFTGAIRDKKGLFEEADGGVIFLDEIGELPLDMQVKLLRAIQEREVKRVGDNRTIKIDVRIIAATNKDLLEEVQEGLFREDLYYRINVFCLKIPPLRERKEDIPLLIDFFLKKSSSPEGYPQVSREAMKILLDYPFPGNIRELENIIERALILCEDNVIAASDIPKEIIEAAHTGYEPAIKGKAASAAWSAVRPRGGYEPSGEGLRAVVRRNREAAEKEIIQKALREARHNKARAAKILKIGRTSLYRKMTKFQLD